MAFSDKWAGEWYGERTNTLMGDGTIDFEKVVEPITVTYAGVGKSGDIKGYKGNHHVVVTRTSPRRNFRNLPKGFVWADLAKTIDEPLF